MTRKYNVLLSLYHSTTSIQKGQLQRTYIHAYELYIQNIYTTQRLPAFNSICDNAPYVLYNTHCQRINRQKRGVNVPVRCPRVVLQRRISPWSGFVQTHLFQMDHFPSVAFAYVELLYVFPVMQKLMHILFKKKNVSTQSKYTHWMSHQMQKSKGC